jgi:putative YphP/YqiW family bacilliredoxin
LIRTIFSPAERKKPMMYDETMVAPMRQELTDLGVVEARTAQEVDQHLANAKGTVMVVVNSVCGCAAAMARPAVNLAMKHAKLPQKSITVFAGNDAEATARARSYFVGYPPSSPSIALLKDGEVVFMLERHNIAGRSAEDISEELKQAFTAFC